MRDPLGAEDAIDEVPGNVNIRGERDAIKCFSLGGEQHECLTVTVGADEVLSNDVAGRRVTAVGVDSVARLADLTGHRFAVEGDERCAAVVVTVGHTVERAALIPGSDLTHLNLGRSVAVGDVHPCGSGAGAHPDTELDPGKCVLQRLANELGGVFGTDVFGHVLFLLCRGKGRRGRPFRRRCG